MNTTELVVENKNWKKFRQLTLYMQKLTVESILNYRFEYSQITLDCKADHFEGNCFVFITSVGQENIWESREGLDIRLSAFYVPRFVGPKIRPQARPFTRFTLETNFSLLSFSFCFFLSEKCRRAVHTSYFHWMMWPVTLPAKAITVFHTNTARRQAQWEF